MTASRADRRSRIIGVFGLVACCAIVAAADARAQTGAPVPLVPPVESEPPAASQPRSPTAPADAPARLPSIPGKSDSGIVVRDLDAVGHDAVGLIGAEAGGLPADMWRGTSRFTAARLLAALPERISSDAAHDLARRLLLTAARPPGGAASDATLVEVRVRKLIMLGASADAAELLRAVSTRSLPASLAELAVTARLLTSDFAGACEAVEAVDTGFTTVFWQKALIFCRLLNQQFAQAVLGLDLLREQETAHDAAFFYLANALVAGTAPTPEQLAEPGSPTALNLALFRVAEIAVPEWFADADAPALLAAVAKSPATDRETRLTAARRAARWGALEPGELAAVYVGLDVGADEITEALLAPESLSPALRLAMLYLAADRQRIAVARAEALREMWRFAAVQGDWRIATRATAHLLDGVAPAPELSWFAGDAVAANLASNNVGPALDWFPVAVGRTQFGDAEVATATLVWPLLRMAARDTDDSVVVSAGSSQTRVAVVREGVRDPAVRGGEAGLGAASRQRVRWDDRRLAEWIAIHEAAGPPASSAIAYVLALFDALGEPIADELWQRADAGAPAAGAFPPTDVWFGMQRAAQAGKVAETALFALAVLGEGEASRLHPVALHAVVRSLSRVGLAGAARALAVEVALAQSR